MSLPRDNGRIKPWDSCLANYLIRPLSCTQVSPNHITTLSLLVGVGSGLLFAIGSPILANWAALLYMLATLLDHCDGELARLTGKTSRFGHCYDLIAGGINYVLLFVGIGIGLRNDAVLGSKAILLGLLAGLSVGIIVTLRMIIEDRGGKSATQQPSFAGFEIEDVLYLIGPITWFGGLRPFLTAAGVGAPIFMFFVLWQFWCHARPGCRE